MCLVALALGVRRRFPLVLASNRDEFFDRPAAPLGWWTPEGGDTAILAGRDLQNGGTWLGLSRAGRIALVTNVRNPADQRPEAPSRGEIVPGWLCGESAAGALSARLAARGYNGVNVLAADLAGDASWHWLSNRSPATRSLSQGLHGLSNAALDTPWPKVETLKRRLHAALQDADSVAQLAGRLFEALSDATPAPDEALPSTGVPLEWERWLSPAFIRTPDGRYGTRCSTLLIAEEHAGRRLTHVIERSHAPGAAGTAGSTRHIELPDWPPRPRPARLTAS